MARFNTGNNGKQYFNLRDRMRRFAGDEEGSLIILSLQIFLIMMIATGVAIDIVRQEERRTLIQATLDRAMLAAADLNQSLDPKEVVKDYFAKSGLSHIVVNPVVKEGDYKEWRSVEANVTDTMPTMFGPLVGITKLYSPAQSRATESIGNVEISLVLDISGSMGDPVTKDDGTRSTRIALLRDAAKDFVDTMFDTVQPPEATPGKLSMSVVPYNQQVVLGNDLASLYNLSTDHTSRTCVDLHTLSFNDLGISPTAELQRTMYGDSFDFSGNGWSVSKTKNIDNCDEDVDAEVLAFANNRTKIKTKISALEDGGDTAIDFGAKWGLALLDPDARKILDKMITKGWADSDLEGRPFDYPKANPSDTDVDSMKVLVLMTDGQNTRSYSTKSQYRKGNSGLVSSKSATAIGSSSDDEKLYYYDPSRSKPYYSFDSRSWKYASQVPSKLYDIKYETLFGSKNFTLQHVIWEYLGEPNNNRTSLYAQMAHQSEFGDKDTDLETICTKAKDSDHKVFIFTIAVDAPSAGEAILKKCATSPSYYFPVKSADMATAFATIASSINALRLTN
jgi:Flp pilus assembly protein TadG